MILVPSFLVVARGLQRGGGGLQGGGCGGGARIQAMSSHVVPTEEAQAAYEALKREVTRVSTLSEIESILSYDEQVFMPPGGAPGRAKQRAVLAGVVHEYRTGPAMRAAVEGARPFLDQYEGRAAANVRLSAEEFEVESRKTQELAEREARLQSEAFETWQRARRASNFSLFAPKLREVLELRREIVNRTRPHLEAYDGALEPFERGMRSSRLDEIFGETKRRLRPILDAVLSRGQPAVRAALASNHPGWADAAKQAALAEKVARALGYDFERGRLDVSAHPFTGGSGPTDTRITTRYSVNNWLEGFAGTVHEVGHALYEQGRDMGPEAAGLPASHALSMGVHESQSLLYERMVLQSRPFWDFATPLFHEFFPHTRDATPDDFYHACNIVSPGKIRVDADELTYPFHVFLRYELERRLVSGALEVDDIPDFWAAWMRDNLGVQVDGHAADGALQDVHWSLGAIGYFPSYALGALCAAQIFAAAKRNLPTLDDDIARGNFAPLREWLRTNIHLLGSVPNSADALLTDLTGTPISPDAFIDYLQAKYLAPSSTATTFYSPLEHALGETKNGSPPPEQEEEEEEELGTTTAADIEHIVNWQPTAYHNGGSLSPEAAAEELARFRLRAGGDMSIDFRDGYRSWRLGRATGATENSSGLLGCHPAARREATMDHYDTQSALYPSLAPAERNTSRYWWRYTVAYWVSTSFMIGSVLFCVGAGFDYFSDELDASPNEIRTSATVHWPYFIGGLFFISGGYMGYFEAINLGRREDLPPRHCLYVPPIYLVVCLLRTRAAKVAPNRAPSEENNDRTELLQSTAAGKARLLDVEPDAWHSFWGYLSYMVGALFFQIGILFDILQSRHAVRPPPDASDHHVRDPPGPSRRAAIAVANATTALPALLGGALFVIGAAFAVDVNESWRPSGAFHDIAWWVSNFNFVGSLLFLEAGVFCFHGLPEAVGSTGALTVKLPYLVGSACFLCASTLELFMWRVDLHGLSFVRAINKSTRLADILREINPVNPSAALADSPEDNSGVSLNTLFFVLVCIFTYAFSLMDLVFAANLARCRHQNSLFVGSAYDIYDAMLQSLLCFAALALASVVHTVPKQRPFGMLTWILRATMFFLLVRYAWKFVISWLASKNSKC
ncbi:hypothetical protein CTAYLR_008304 [Chrysophaeum taylorii]|uniref:Carboxypeptidase n=1 Tax=Chrysophaeum taylorii TaxID=2483200 RepID=A0AAD7U7A8_9STRA|nr:hypothetical protein CTAYLR_008304 [Chrysophaeum taylorii]